MKTYDTYRCKECSLLSMFEEPHRGKYVCDHCGSKHIELIDRYKLQGD